MMLNYKNKSQSYTEIKEEGEMHNKKQPEEM